MSTLANSPKPREEELSQALHRWADTGLLDGRCIEEHLYAANRQPYKHLTGVIQALVKDIERLQKDRPKDVEELLILALLQEGIDTTARVLARYSDYSDSDPKILERIRGEASKCEM